MLRHKGDVVFDTVGKEDVISGDILVPPCPAGIPGTVEIGGGPGVPFALQHFGSEEPALMGVNPVPAYPYRVVRGAVIADDQFQVGVCLLVNAVQGLDHRLGRIVGDDGDGNRGLEDVAHTIGIG